MKVWSGRRARVLVALAGALVAIVDLGSSLGGVREAGNLGAPTEPAEQAEEVKSLADQLASLGVAKGDVTQLVQACRAAGFTEAEVRRVLRLVVRAELAGLPHRALVNKLREGLAKRATPEGIEGAMEKRAQTLRQAKGLTDVLLVEGWVTSDYGLSLQMVADVLEAGASPSDVLRSVREGRPLGEVPDVRAMFRR
jgi:hypothetical protein